MIITEKDCKDKLGFVFYREETEAINRSLGARILGRILAADTQDPKSKKVIAKKGNEVNKEIAAEIDTKEVSQVAIRSILT